MQTMLEYGLVGLLLLATVGRWMGPKVFTMLSKHKLTYPSSDDYHVVELRKDKGNPFWFRIFLERRILKAGVSRIELSKRATYILVLIKPNGEYEHTLMVKGCRQPIPRGRDAWRPHLEGMGFPAKGYPERNELDALYTHQPRIRNQRRRRSSHPPVP